MQVALSLSDNDNVVTYNSSFEPTGFGPYKREISLIGEAITSSGLFGLFLDKDGLDESLERTHLHLLANPDIFDTEAVQNVVPAIFTEIAAIIGGIKSSERSIVVGKFTLPWERVIGSAMGASIEISPGHYEIHVRQDHNYPENEWLPSTPFSLNDLRKYPVEPIANPFLTAVNGYPNFYCFQPDENNEPFSRFRDENICLLLADGTLQQLDYTIIKETFVFQRLKEKLSLHPDKPFETIGPLALSANYYPQHTKQMFLLASLMSYSGER